jgi:hypothetical protein
VVADFGGEGSSPARRKQRCRRCFQGLQLNSSVGEEEEEVAEVLGTSAE